MAVLAWSANTSYCLIASTILPFAAVIISVGFNVDMTDVLPGPDGDVTPGPDEDVTPGFEGSVGELDVVRHSSVKSRPPGLKHQISFGSSLMYEQLSGHEESPSIKLRKGKMSVIRA